MCYDSDTYWAPPSTHSSHLTTWFLIVPNTSPASPDPPASPQVRHSNLSFHLHVSSRALHNPFSTQKSEAD